MCACWMDNTLAKARVDYNLVQTDEQASISNILFGHGRNVIYVDSGKQSFSPHLLSVYRRSIIAK